VGSIDAGAAVEAPPIRLVAAMGGRREEPWLLWARGFLGLSLALRVAFALLFVLVFVPAVAIPGAGILDPTATEE
jgi:hypothetical protein